MNTRAWIYALTCVLLPILWGLAMVWVTNWMERRYRARRRQAAHDPSSPAPSTLEYHI